MRMNVLRSHLTYSRFCNVLRGDLIPRSDCIYIMLYISAWNCDGPRAQKKYQMRKRNSDRCTTRLLGESKKLNRSAAILLMPKQGLACCDVSSFWFD